MLMRGLRYREILDQAAEAYSISVEQLRSRCKCRQCVGARATAAKLLRDAGASLHRIGMLIGRDHSTVVYLLRRRPRGGPDL